MTPVLHSLVDKFCGKHLLRKLLLAVFCVLLPCAAHAESLPQTALPGAAPSVAVQNQNAVRMGIILPGVCADLVWNQGMCEAVNNFPPLADGSTLAAILAENKNDTVLAEDQARKFLADGVPIILLHGSQFLPVVRKLAVEFPSTMFVLGSNEKTPFPNVVAYDVQPQEGAYLMGMAAGLMTRTNIISIIAPVDVNEAVGHARGFEEGVIATNPQAAINVTYTGTFDNPRLAATLARRSLQTGADILTGSAQQSLGALHETSITPGALWVGSGYDMSSVAPQTVLASQVYDFRAMLIQMLNARLKGSKGGYVIIMSLSTGTMHLQWGDMVPASIRAIVDKKQQHIMDGTFKPDIKTLRYHSIAGY